MQAGISLWIIPVELLHHYIVMAKYETIEQVLDKTEQVIKFKSTIVRGIVLSVFGACLLVVSGQINAAPGSILSPLLLITGVILAIWGVTALLNRKIRYKLVADDKRISFSEIYFDVNEKQELLRIMSERDVEALSRLSSSDSNGLQLRIAATADGSLCYTQLKSFIPYEYIEISTVCRHTPEEARAILDLKNNRK